MLEAKAAKFCSKFPQHLFSVTFQLSQPCYVSPFINVYEVVAITTAIKQTKIANECLSFSICLYYPAPPPHPAPPYSLPTPTVSQVVTTPREQCSATTLLLHPIAPPPSLVSVSEQTASFQTLTPLFLPLFMSPSCLFDATLFGLLAFLAPISWSHLFVSGSQTLAHLVPLCTTAVALLLNELSQFGFVSRIPL